MVAADAAAACALLPLRAVSILVEQWMSLARDLKAVPRGVMTLSEVDELHKSLVENAALFE